MKGTQRISKLFKDLFDGSPWIGENIKGMLEQLSAPQAARKVLPGRNSIWEILNHVTGWRQTVLQRVQGNDVPSPDHNFFEPIRDVSEAAWKMAQERLKDSQVQWMAFLEKADETVAGKHYEMIYGILQHDAYHLGQMVMLSKVV